MYFFNFTQPAYWPARSGACWAKGVGASCVAVPVADTRPAWVSWRVAACRACSWAFPEWLRMRRSRSGEGRCRGLHTCQSKAGRECGEGVKAL